MKEILLSIGAIVISVINMVAKMNMTGDVFDKIIGDKFTDEDHTPSLGEMLLFIPCLIVIVIIPCYYIYKKCLKQMSDDIDEIYDEEEW